MTRWTLTLALALLVSSVALADRAEERDYKRRASKLSPRDVRGHFVLALWCAQKKMPGRAWKHNTLVLDIKPDHRAALRALKTLRPNIKALAREALREPNAIIRGGAVRALRKTRRPVASILPALHSKSVRTRRRAIGVLGALGNESAVAPLIAHLSVAGGNTTGAYIGSGAQQSIIRDFDVEVS